MTTSPPHGARRASPATAGCARRSTAPPSVPAWPCTVPTSTWSPRSSTTTPGARSPRPRPPRADQRAAGSGGTVAAATRIGTLVAERAKAAGIDKVVFDRGGFLYHGRIAAARRQPAREGRSGVLIASGRVLSYTAVPQQPVRQPADRAHRGWPARVAGHHDQPRRQGRARWPSLLVHGARRDRRRQRPRRSRLRQGQGGAAGDPEGHRGSQAQPVRGRRWPARRSPTR